MTRTELLSLAERLETINPAGKSSADLDADELFLQGAAIILRKLAELRPAAWRFDAMEGHECPELWTYTKGPSTNSVFHEHALYQLSEVLTDE